MKAKKLYLMDTHLAGRKYYDCDEVFEELKVGTVLYLERDESNPHDDNAVEVIYRRPVSLRIVGTDDEDNIFKLGYIPREENGTIAPYLEMGWNEIFECRISKIDPEAHYEHQICLNIKIKRKK